MYEKGHCDFEAALLKGAIEKDDGTVYFGSLGAYSYYVKSAINRGWIVTDDFDVEATPEGLRVYAEAGLGALPQNGRAYMWDWRDVDLTPFLKEPK